MISAKSTQKVTQQKGEKSHMKMSLLFLVDRKTYVHNITHQFHQYNQLIHRSVCNQEYIDD